MYHNKQLKHQNLMLDLLSTTVQEGPTSHWANALLFETERTINKEICKAFMLLWSLTAEVANISPKQIGKRCLNIYQLDRLDYLLSPTVLQLCFVQYIYLWYYDHICHEYILRPKLYVSDSKTITAWYICTLKCCLLFLFCLISL